MSEPCDTAPAPVTRAEYEQWLAAPATHGIPPDAGRGSRPLRTFRPVVDIHLEGDLL